MFIHNFFIKCGSGRHSDTKRDIYIGVCVTPSHAFDLCFTLTSSKVLRRDKQGCD